MSNIFNASEVIDMGIEKERKRRDFYGLVSMSFADKAMKELFANLRDWEDAHIRKFTEIRDSIDESKTTESYEGETESYMKTLVDDKLYGQVSPSEFKKNVDSEIKAILFGIGFEKDAILFFNELLKYMSPLHKERIGLLIDEEKKHIIYLAELKRKYE